MSLPTSAISPPARDPCFVFFARLAVNFSPPRSLTSVNSPLCPIGQAYPVISCRHPASPALAALAWLLALLLSSSSCAAERLLIYQRNGKGYVHDNLAASAQALQEIAAGLNLETDLSTNATVFTAASLARYRAVIFANSNNEAFETEEQRAAFQKFIQAGGGFMGIHSSTGSERNWPWFQQLQGAKFLRHPPMQTFTAKVIEPRHPSTAHLPAQWRWTDECYFFTNANPNVRVLLALDPATLRDPKLASEPGQKLAWCHEQEGSRRFYSSLGHKIEHYSEPAFRQHLAGGIRWILGKND